MSAIEYPSVSLAAGKTKKKGALSLHGNTPSTGRISFLGEKAKGAANIATSDTLWYTWVHIGRILDPTGGYCLKIGMVGNKLLRISGFKDSAFKTISDWLSSIGFQLKREEGTTRGRNWGDVLVDNEVIKITNEGKTIMDIPLQSISQTIIQSKNEIQIEFLQPDEGSAFNQLENLLEMRIFSPEEVKEEKDTDDTKMEEDGEEKEGVEVDGDEKEEGDDDVEQETPAEKLLNLIQIKTGTSEVAKPFTSFSLNLQVPRGKYDVDMYNTYFKLHSKTFQYKILYKNVTKMFLLENKHQNVHFFVIGLHPPVRQGRTAYPFLVIQFDNDEVIEREFDMDEKSLNERYEGALKPRMSGPAYDLTSRVFKAMLSKKLLIPGNQYLSSGGDHCVRTSYKANDGYLYMLEKSFMFLKKPPMHIRHSDIKTLSFERVSKFIGSGSRSFDIRIVTQSDEEVVFSSIQRDEYDNINQFLKNKGIDIASTYEGPSVSQSALGRARADTSYAEDDPGMNQGGSDSEDDSDFEASSSDSSSDSDDDMQSEASTDEDDGAKKRSKPKEKKERKKREASSEEEGSEDEEGSSRKRKRGGKKEKSVGPKRATTAYFFFLADAREKYKAQDVSMSHLDLMKQMAMDWKELSAEEKQKYEDMHEADKQRYNRELAEMRESGQLPEKKPSKSSKSSKSSKAVDPTKAQSAFQFYAQLNRDRIRESDPSLSASDIAKAVSTQFKALSEEERQPYVEMHIKAKKAAKKALEEEKIRRRDNGEEEEEEKKSGEEEDEAEKEKKEKKKKKKEHRKYREGGEDGEEKEKKKKKKKDKKKEKKERQSHDGDAEGEAEQDVDMANEGEGEGEANNDNDNMEDEPGAE